MILKTAFSTDPTEVLTIKGNATLNLSSPDVSGDNGEWIQGVGINVKNLTINRTSVNVAMGNSINTSTDNVADSRILGTVVDGQLTLKGGANLNVSIGVASAKGNNTFGVGLENVDQIYLYGGTLAISSASADSPLLPRYSKVIDYKGTTIKNDTTTVVKPSVTYNNNAILIEKSDFCEIVGDKIYTPAGCGNDVYVSDSSTVTVQLKDLPAGQPFKNWTIAANGIVQTQTGNSFSLNVQKDTNYVIAVNFIVKLTFHFQTNGGSIIADIEVDKGEKIAAPTAPTKDGFAFGGWFKDADLTTAWIFENDTVTEETTLYAKWNVALGSGSDDVNGLSAGALIGFVLGGVVALLIVAYAVLFFIFYRKNKLTGKFWDVLFVPMNKLFAKKETSTQE